MIWVHALKGSALDQLSKQSLTHADATPWHETLTLPSNENTNPFPKQTTPPLWTEGGGEWVLFCFSVSNAVGKQGQCVRWSVGPTYSFTSFGQGVPQELLQFDLFVLGWGEARPLTRTPASTSNATMERGKDQPQSSSGHVPFLSPLVKAATNYRKGAWAELPCSADLCDTVTGRHGAKLKANLQSI